MRAFPLFILSGLTTLGAWQTAAQGPGTTQFQQLETVEQRQALEARAASLTASNAPSLFPGEDADVGPQSVLKIKRRLPGVELFADAQYFYTDNMFLTDENRRSADVLVSTIQGTISAPEFGILGGSFVPRLGYRHQWFDYGLADRRTIEVFDFETLTVRNARLNEFDFNAQTVFADGTWRRDNWFAGLSFNYRRLMDTENYDQFYREFTPGWSLKRVVPLCSHSAITVGYEGDYRATDTDRPPAGFDSNFNDRTDHSLAIDSTYVICKHAVAQVYYRFQYTYFTGNERREDFLNLFGAALYCPLNDYVGIRFFANYDLLRTNGKLVSDYNRLDTGAGLNLSVRF